MRLQHPFLQIVNDFIVGHDLLSPEGKYLVALSGGADSIALLKSLSMLHYNVEAVHCNFHLRGEESDRDEAFCRQRCDELGVCLHVAHFATKEYAEVHHVSVEMAARDLRYDYFEKLRRDVGADDVVVAHHKDDSVETVLMNLIRGTGLHGLMGIAPRRDHIVRPLLCVSRQQIEAFLDDLGVPYVTDSTNLCDDVVRNKIRLNVIPRLKEINPSATEAIAKTASRLRQAAEIFDEAIAGKITEARVKTEDLDDSCLEAVFDIDKIVEEYTLFHILAPYGFSSSMIENVFKALKTARSGAVFCSVSHELLIDRGKLIVQAIQPVFQPYRIPEEGIYRLSNQCRLCVTRVPLEEVTFKKGYCDTIFVDADKLSFPLIIRTAMPGDRIHPLGMKGSRLVSDILTDEKVNLFDKRRQLVLVDAKGEIVWLVGRRLNRHFSITPHTQSVLKIQYLVKQK